MSIYLDGQCDTHGCKSQFKDNDIAYCTDCYESLLEENRNLLAELEDLKAELKRT